MTGFRLWRLLSVCSGIVLSCCLNVTADELQICQPCELLNTHELPAVERVGLDALRIRLDAAVSGEPVPGDDIVGLAQKMFGVVEATVQERLAAAAELRAIAEGLNPASTSSTRLRICRRTPTKAGWAGLRPSAIARSSAAAASRS